MVTRRNISEHGGERFIDPEQWPYLVEAPHALLMSRRAENLTERLEVFLHDAGISIDQYSSSSINAVSLASPSVVSSASSRASALSMSIKDGQLIDRIVARGWLGLAEGYMAGEWSAQPLEKVLEKLLNHSFEGKLERVLGRKTSRGVVHSGYGSQSSDIPRIGELPHALVELYAGATRATGSGVFSSTSRTTSSEKVEITPLRSMRTKPIVRSFMKAPVLDSSVVDVTWFGDVEGVERQDLDDAQQRRIDSMLDESHVGPGDRVLELPSSGGQLAISAAMRGARVDVLTNDESHAAAVRARVRAAGVAGAVRVEVIPHVIPSLRQWSGSYDVIFSVERIETLGKRGLVPFLKAIDRMLAEDGVAVVQALVATPQARDTAMQALDVYRAYIWPHYELSTVMDVRTASVEHTTLRVVAENHYAEHSRATAALWLANFAAAERQAAAAGFDRVFRRLWEYQLSLHQALIAGGDMDCVQFVFEHR